MPSASGVPSHQSLQSTLTNVTISDLKSYMPVMAVACQCLDLALSQGRIFGRRSLSGGFIMLIQRLLKKFHKVSFPT